MARRRHARRRRRGTAPVVLAALLAAALSLASLVLAPARERVWVREGVSGALERFRDLDEDAATSLLRDAGLDADDLVRSGVDAPAFMRHLLAHFDYQVGAAVIDGDRATVPVRMSALDARSAIEQLEEEIAAHVEDYAPTLLAEGEARSLDEQLLDELFAKVDEGGAISRDMTLHLTKRDGAWVVDEGDARELARAMLGL